MKEQTKGYSLTLALCRSTRRLLTAYRPSVLYELPTLPPYLVHHSLSRVKSRVHGLLQETKACFTSCANQRPAGSCIMSAGHIAPIHVTKSRSEQHDRANTTSAVPLKHKVCICAVPSFSKTDLRLTFLLLHGTVHSLYAGSLVCLNCDVPHPCSVHNPLPSLDSLQSTVRNNRLPANSRKWGVKKWKWIWSKVHTADVFVNSLYIFGCLPNIDLQIRNFPQHSAPTKCLKKIQAPPQPVNINIINLPRAATCHFVNVNLIHSPQLCPFLSADSYLYFIIS